MMNTDPCRILVVDDETLIVQFLQTFIGAEGDAYQVKTSVTGDDAVRQAVDFRPHVVVLDIGIPGKDGYEVCEAIKADPGCKHTVVIGMTGKPEKEAHDRIIESGAIECLHKPFDFKVFTAMISKYAKVSRDREAGRS
jgi:two-component system, OmpR family, response regulator